MFLSSVESTTAVLATNKSLGQQAMAERAALDGIAGTGECDLCLLACAPSRVVEWRE